MSLIELLFAVCIVGLIVLVSILIDQNRRILDALHTLIAQGNLRRQWAREEKCQGLER